MGTKRQKNQLELAFLDDPRGEAPRACEEGTEVSMARRGDERPAGTGDLTEEVVEDENVKKALRRVQSKVTSRQVVYERPLIEILDSGSYRELHLLGR